MIPLHEVQKQANLICDDRSQVGGFLWRARSSPEEEAQRGWGGAGVTLNLRLRFMHFITSRLHLNFKS